MNAQQLHTFAADTLAQIETNRNLIEKIKSQLVEIEKDPVLTNGHKRMFIEQFQEQLNIVRETKRSNVETYAAVMKQLTEPIFDRMAVSSNGAITNVLIAERYYNHD